MTKVTVKRVVKAGSNPYFVVEWDGGSKFFSFKENTPADDVYNEQTNRRAAMEFAKKIESGQIVNGEEIIYETPLNPEP